MEALGGIYIYIQRREEERGGGLYRKEEEEEEESKPLRARGSLLRVYLFSGMPLNLLKNILSDPFYFCPTFKLYKSIINNFIILYNV